MERDEYEKIFETAETLCKNGDYAEAAKWYQKAVEYAEQGDADAQYSLGIRYELGKGVERSYEDAVKWYKKAAERGNVDAQYSLGFLFGKGYGKGNGAPQSEEEVVEWWKNVAKRERGATQFDRGFCASWAEACSEIDRGTTVIWWRKAVDQGYLRACAQFRLGFCYYKGQGVKQNDEEAIKWWKKAAGQGPLRACAQFMIGLCYENGRGVKRNDKEAVEWYKKAAKQGYAEAQKALGNCYYYGIGGVAQDYVKANKWFRKAYKQGVYDIQRHLQACHDRMQEAYHEKAEKKRYPKVLKAAKKGDADAQYGLGNCYFYGKGVAKNCEEAVKWYKKAAEQGHKEEIGILKQLGIN